MKYSGQHTDSQVETVLAGNLHEVLVCANTGGFESLRRKLLVLIGNEMHAEREFVDTRTLTAQVEDADLGIRNTSVETRLGVRLVCRGKKPSAFLYISMVHSNSISPPNPAICPLPKTPPGPPTPTRHPFPPKSSKTIKDVGFSLTLAVAVATSWTASHFFRVLSLFGGCLRGVVLSKMGNSGSFNL